MHQRFVLCTAVFPSRIVVFHLGGGRGQSGRQTEVRDGGLEPSTAVPCIFQLQERWNGIVTICRRCRATCGHVFKPPASCAARGATDNLRYKREHKPLCHFTVQLTKQNDVKSQGLTCKLVASSFYTCRLGRKPIQLYKKRQGYSCKRPPRPRGL
jgi:hypothetical protein